MPELKGIKFNDPAFQLVSRLIARLKETGVVEEYGLPKMNELRLAHHCPNIDRAKAKGVFGRLAPSKTGAVHLRKGGSTALTETTFEDVLSAIDTRRAIVKDKLKGFEKADPNKPGTVSGGQFESNHSKH